MPKIAIRSSIVPAGAVGRSRWPPAEYARDTKRYEAEEEAAEGTVSTGAARRKPQSLVFGKLRWMIEHPEPGEPPVA
jgi:hypothetical protein